MKTRKFLMAALMMLGAVSASAQNELKIADVTANPDEQTEVNVELVNADEVLGFQLALTLPEGLEFVEDEDEECYYLLNADRLAKKTKFDVSGCDEVKNNTLTFICFSNKAGEVLLGNEGTIMTTWIKGVAGTYTVKVSKLAITTADDVTKEYEDFTFGVTVGGTAITSVKAEAALENAAIYNMAGQRVSKAYKGVVICNGKKYMNK